MMRLATVAICLVCVCSLLCLAGLFGGCQIGPAVSPEEAIAHYVAAQRLKDDAALAELNKAIQADPSCSVAHTAIGDIHRKRGNYELARRAYETACAANPYFFRPHYNLGVVYQFLAEAAKSPQLYEDFLRKACDIYLRAITIEANDYDANLNLSACYFQLGKYNQAEQYCQAAINLDPKRPEAFTNLGIIYDSENRLYEAIKAYKQSLELDTHQPKLWLNLGSTLMRQGTKDRLEIALTSFQNAAKEDPTSSAPWEQLGSCHFRLGNVDKATEAYQKAIALNARSADAFRGMGIIYMTQYLADPAKTALRDKGLTQWNTSLEINPNQDDLKKLVEKYTPKTAATTKPL
jgi:tetratricopeptide (TPR) repeat protein